MAQQTINVGAAPNDGTGTPLRTAFQYTNSNFGELYTAVGPSGNNIVVPGTATITGDLTVDTSTLKVDSTNNRVGIGTATPAAQLHLQAAGTDTAVIRLAATGGRTFDIGSTAAGYGSANNLIIYDITGSAERFRIDSTGIFTFSNVGGGAGTAMTLNSTGLGIGVASGSISAKLHIDGNLKINGATSEILMATGAERTISASGSASSTVLTFKRWNGVSYVSDVVMDGSGNVGIGVTPSAWASIYRGIQMRESYAAILSDNGNGVCEITSNAYNDGAWKYANALKAARYQLDGANGQHEWYTAGTGTVGGTITFTERLRLKETGQLRFIPLAADPSGAEAGDVYYNSSSNKLKCYNGSTWNDLF